MATETTETSDVQRLAADLRDEQEVLDGLVADLPGDRWATPTPSPGWTVADQIGHLTYFDGTAATAIVDPEAFKASVVELLGAGDMEDVTLHRSLRPAELLDRWRANRRRLADVAATLTDGDRVPWYGPSMGAKSFVTARSWRCGPTARTWPTPSAPSGLPPTGSATSPSSATSPGAGPT